MIIRKCGLLFIGATLGLFMIMTDVLADQSSSEKQSPIEKQAAEKLKKEGLEAEKWM